MIKPTGLLLTLTACLGIALLALTACSDSGSTPSSDLADAAPSDGGNTLDGLASPDNQLPGGVTFSVGGSLGGRLRYTVAPQALAYNFLVESSDLGLEGLSGAGSLIAHEDGTYTPSGAPQARLIYSPQTLLIGAETIQLVGLDRPLLFAGVPSRSVVYLPGEIAGLFNFIEYSCDKAVDASCGQQAYVTSHGTIEVAANGAFSLCRGGDLGDVRAAPCVTKQEGQWDDEGAGLISLRAPGELVIGQGMLLPSSQGGKLLVLDLRDTTAGGPGLLVALERVSLAGANLAGTFHFVGDDGNYGLIVVDSSKDAYHKTRHQPGLEPVDDRGSFSRDTPWAGWIAAVDATGGRSDALVLPDVGAWISTSLPAGTNSWIEIGARLN